jgi:hypothetical protein
MAPKIKPSRDLLCEVNPSVVEAFARAVEGVPFGLLPRAKRKLLARIAACRFSCERYLQEVARIRGKKLIFVRGGVPVDEPPTE